MLKKIKKGEHFDNDYFSSFPLFFFTKVRRTIRFTETCRYTLPSGEQEDVNKLFGVAFGMKKKGYDLPHWNSARIGWRYDKASDSIYLYAYQYENGKRRISLFAKTYIGCECDLTIEIIGNRIFYSAKGNRTLSWSLSHKGISWFGVTLGTYFGGNIPAPHDIHIHFVNRLEKLWRRFKKVWKS